MDKYISGARSRSGSRSRQGSPARQVHDSKMAATGSSRSSTRRESRSNLPKGAVGVSMDIESSHSTSTSPSPSVRCPANVDAVPRLSVDSGRPIENQPSIELPADIESLTDIAPLSKEDSSELLFDSAEHKIAKAVAALLLPTITATVDKAITSGMALLSGRINEHTDRLNEAEQRISFLEDDREQSTSMLEKIFRDQQLLHDKMEDLENRSRRNNLRIIGLPETYKPAMLHDICSFTLPENLGIRRQCVVERAHRIGAASSDRPNPRAVIVRYLNYSDRSDILQAFRSSRSLVIDGHKLLLFADYSLEVSKKRKEFQSVCSQLYKLNVKFMLAYPAILKLHAPTGEQLTFHCPVKADSYLRTLASSPAPRASYADKAKMGTRDQRSPRKDPPKRMKPVSSDHSRDLT